MNLKIKPNGYLLLGITVWRLILTGLAFLASHLFKYGQNYTPTFPYSNLLLDEKVWPGWLARWANFDGVHYLTIVHQGYQGLGLIQAFFPVFPLSILAVTKLGIDPLIGGQLISLLALTISLFIWQGIIKHLFPKTPMAFFWFVIITLLWPVSFFFIGVYTESLFFLFLSLSIYWAIKKRWWLAALSTGLLTGTRITGVAFVPGLILMFLGDQWSIKQLITAFKHNWLKSFALAAVAGWGLILYCYYLYLNFGDPFLFSHVQSEFGAGRESHFLLFPQAWWRATKVLWTARPFDFKYWTYFQDWFFGSVSFFGLIWLWKKIPPSIWLFSCLAILLPISTGSFSSLPRYALIAVGFHLGLAGLFTHRPKLGIVYLLGSTILLIINVMLFLQGKWVA